VVAPEPSFEPSREPSAACAGARDPDPVTVDDRPGTGGGVGEFFARLGPGWPLTSHQRRRLAPMAVAALETGWAPAALAEFAGTNTVGVRSPYAVLAARLSPAELPAPPDRSRSRPPWCRDPSCDEGTRRLRRADDGDGGRCPRCHPLAADSALAARGIPDVNAGARRGLRPAASRSRAATMRTVTKTAV
jgi:hypothetical protein